MQLIPLHQKEPKGLGQGTELSSWFPNTAFEKKSILRPNDTCSYSAVCCTHLNSWMSIRETNYADGNQFIDVILVSGIEGLVLYITELKSTKMRESMLS